MNIEPLKLNVLNKNVYQLQNYRSCRALQIQYKVCIHTTSNEKIRFFK